jgi:ribonuclease HII
VEPLLGKECRWQPLEEPLEVGVDEAGRGSIIGEMFVVAYAIPIGCEDVLVELGVRDSKELTRTQKTRHKPVFSHSKRKSRRSQNT